MEPNLSFFVRKKSIDSRNMVCYDKENEWQERIIWNKEQNPKTDFCARLWRRRKQS
jgi:cell fate regulator YaaT (PSP1 superfamily)